MQSYLLQRYREAVADKNAAMRLSSDHLESRTIALAAGPSHIAGGVSREDLAGDRSVELLGLWKTAHP